MMFLGGLWTARPGRLTASMIAERRMQGDQGGYRSISENNSAYAAKHRD